MTMIVQANFASLKQNKPHEWVMRFVFGGLATVAAGLIAEHFGPSIGGLFLAFPAIFPAGATLIEKHEKQMKEKAGFEGERRGRDAASLDSAGAALGAIGLITFAAIIWQLLPDHSPWSVLPAAGLAWLAVSGSLWWLRKKVRVLGTRAAATASATR